MVNLRAFALVVLLALGASSWAEDLVPRVVQVTWDWGGAGPDAVFVTQLLRATLAQDAAYLVAEEGDKADASLTLRPVGKTLQVEFHDGLDAGKDWTQALPLPALTAKALRTAVSTVLGRVQQSLPPVPQQVREVVTEKVVQDVQVHTQEKGLTVTLRGVPGSRVAFAGGTTGELGADGTLVLPDQVQYSSVVFDVSRPGYFSRHVEAALTDQDAEVDARLTERPRWSVTAGVGGTLMSNVLTSYRLTDGTLELAMNLVKSGWTGSSFVTTSLPNPLGLPLGTLPSVWWVQTELGAQWFGSRPEDFFQWGFAGLGTLRFDGAVSGVELSQWFPFGLKAQVLAEFRFAPWFSFDLAVGSWLAYSSANLTWLQNPTINPDGTSGPRYAVEVLGYDYQETVEDLVTVAPGALYLRPLMVNLGLRFSF